MTPPKPCPFCGKTGVAVRQGETFRWRYIECNNCGARCGDVRVQTMGDGTRESWEAEAYERAVEEWNTRTPPC